MDDDLGLDLDNHVSVEWMILADYVEVVNGKLYLMGGGWDTIVVEPTFPVTRPLAIAVAVRVPWNETNQRHQVEIEVQDEDAASLATIGGHFEVGRPPRLPHGHSQRFQLGMNVAVPFARAGTFRLVARLNGAIDARTTFHVATSPAAR